MSQNVEYQVSEFPAGEGCWVQSSCKDLEAERDLSKAAAASEPSVG